MFPYSNLHYTRHYNIGDPDAIFKNNTEYKHQYLKYPSKEYHIQLEGVNEPIKEQPREIPSAHVKYKSEERKVNPVRQYQYKEEEKYVPEYKEEIFKVPKQEVNYKFNQPAYNGHRPKIKQEAIVKPIEVKKTNNVVNEQEVEVYKLLEGSAPSRKNNMEDLEKKKRAKKYKEYLDLQIQLNNEKHKYEKLNKQQANEQLRNRGIRLRQIEEDIIKRTKEQQTNLARIYERQIQEQRISKKANSLLDGENAFTDSFDVNRQRYFKVDYI